MHGVKTSENRKKNSFKIYQSKNLIFESVHIRNSESEENWLRVRGVRVV